MVAGRRIAVATKVETVKTAMKTIAPASLTSMRRGKERDEESEEGSGQACRVESEPGGPGV